MPENKINSAMSKVINKHADEIETISSIARVAKANSEWCKRRVQKISDIWDGTIKVIGIIVTVLLVGLWIVITRSWYYAESCTGVNCIIKTCPNYWAILGGAIISLLLLAGGIALTWIIARKSSIENLCSRI